MAAAAADSEQIPDQAVQYICLVSTACVRLLFTTAQETSNICQMESKASLVTSNGKRLMQFEFIKSRTTSNIKRPRFSLSSRATRVLQRFWRSHCSSKTTQALVKKILDHGLSSSHVKSIRCFTLKHEDSCVHDISVLNEMAPILHMHKNNKLSYYYYSGRQCISLVCLSSDAWFE
jgi:hypothetical protein